MRPYETMVIFDPDADDTAVNGVLARAEQIIKANGGTPGTVDRWGRRTLAYEVRKKREGYYVLLEFTAEPKAAEELHRMLTLADEVMRHKVIRQSDKVAGRKSAEAAATAAQAG
jgi:small subunit ribosomal protein S6